MLSLVRQIGKISNQFKPLDFGCFGAVYFKDSFVLSDFWSAPNSEDSLDLDIIR